MVIPADRVRESGSRLGARVSPTADAPPRRSDPRRRVWTLACPVLDEAEDAKFDHLLTWPDLVMCKLSMLVQGLEAVKKGGGHEKLVNEALGSRMDGA